MTITSVSIFHKGTIKDRYNLREGMGLPEYQAVPSLRDVAHDGVLCSFSNRSAPDRSSLGRYVFGSVLSYNKAPPACLG